MKECSEKRREHRFRLVAVALFLVLNIVSLTVSASAYASLLEQPSLSVTSPPVVLQTGTAGNSTIYTNNTSAKVNVGASIDQSIEDYVDVNSSNVDSHTGHGTSSNFTAQQDSNISYNDTLTEANTGGTVNTEDYVDGNLSDVDGHADHGTSSNFTAQQDSNIAFNDTLTEANTGGTQVEELWVTGFTSTELDWTEVGGSPYLGAIDYATNYIYTTTRSIYESTFTYADSVKNSTNVLSAVQVCIYAYGAGDDSIEVSVWNGSANTVIDFVTPTTTWTWYDLTCTTTLDTWAKVQASALRVQSSRQGGTMSEVRVDASLIRVNSTALSNYEIDKEFNYTVTGWGQTNEYLCIRTHTYSGIVAENLGVDWWNSTSSAWVTVAASLTASTWNNISISAYLTAANIYFRFIGKSETLDLVQNTWIMECNLIHCWTDPNYELDYEIQWTAASHSEEHEYLCIRTDTYSGTAENIGLDVWSAGSWTSISSALTASTWNNISINTYLTSATITFRFIGKTESSDTSQNTWKIECALLHVWSSAEATYDYVLGVNNTITSSWQVRLKEYSSSSIARLQNCTISFHNSTDGTSNQIVIENGSFTTQTGSWYDLSSLQTIYMAITVHASSLETSYIYAYLEVLIPGTKTYARYTITFEIT